MNKIYGLITSQYFLVMKVYLFIGYFFTISYVNAQRVVSEYGKIPKDEIEMTTYNLDSEADAVVLFDFGKTYFVDSEQGYEYIFERTTRIKILSDAGVDWAEISIPYYETSNRYEKVFEIEATTYNIENGLLSKSSLDKSTIFDEKDNNNWKEKKFALPNVRKGSIIEYKYKLQSPYLFTLPIWNFQWRIPVEYSEVQVSLWPQYEYATIKQGITAFDVDENFDDKSSSRTLNSGVYVNKVIHDKVFKYGMKNVPAFKNESYISSINDYIIQLRFQLARYYSRDGSKIEVITTWQKLSNELLDKENFGQFLKKSQKEAEKMLQLADLKKLTEMERFNVVLDFVKQNYSWNKRYGIFADNNYKDFQNTKQGNAAALNLFTIGLLKAVGIEAVPCIISTRKHGKISPNYPFVSFFDYVLIHTIIDGQMVLADATTDLLRNDRIPSYCINDLGLLIDKKEPRFIDIECWFPSLETTFIQLKVNEKTLNGFMILKADEYTGLDYKNDLIANSKKIIKEFDEKNYDIDESSLDIKNQNDRIKPITIKFNFNTPLEHSSDKFYISPFLNEIDQNTPFKEVERKYPVDFIYPIKKEYNSAINIPDGYTIDFIPEDLVIQNELFELNYKVNILQEKVQVLFSYSFKNPVYNPENYHEVRDFVNKIIEKGNQKLIFKIQGQ